MNFITKLNQILKESILKEYYKNIGYTMLYLKKADINVFYICIFDYIL